MIEHLPWLLIAAVIIGLSKGGLASAGALAVPMLAIFMNPVEAAALYRRKIEVLRSLPETPQNRRNLSATLRLLAVALRSDSAAQVDGALWAEELGLNVDDPFTGQGTLSRVVSGVTLHGVGA